MDASTGIIALPQRRSATLPWTVAILEGLVIAALVVAMLMARGGSQSTVTGSSVTQVLPHDAAVQMVGADYVQYGITGTGPALGLIATWSQPHIAVEVTGTGPGLTQVAQGSSNCHPGWCPPASEG